MWVLNAIVDDAAIVAVVLVVVIVVPVHTLKKLNFRPTYVSMCTIITITGSINNNICRRSRIKYTEMKFSKR